MMNVWQKSNLNIGDELTISRSLFIEPQKAKKRLVAVYYIGETENGIMVDCSFRPPVKTDNPELYHYKMMINWSSIYCGHVIVLGPDGTMVRTRRIAKC